MNQVLSQQEIDSLLNALDTGDIDQIEIESKKDNIRTYDFKRPIKLSKEYTNTLYMIFENFSKISSNLLSSQLNVEVELSLASIDQISFEEFVRSIPKVTLLGIFNSDPLVGMQVLEMNPKLCMDIIELICGGSGVQSKNMIKNLDEFTDIEISILEETINLLLQGFEASWIDVVEMDAKIGSIDTNPQMIQNMSPNEPVILISFTTKIMDATSFMNICIPFAALESIIDKLSIKNWFDFEKETTTKDEGALKDSIMQSKVDLSVLLGNTGITVEDFLSLESGDILQLDKVIDKPLSMYIEDKPYLFVKPGLYNGSYAVEVLQYIEEDVE